MRINVDFDRRVVVPPDESDWAASPQAGVERRMLDRIGGEVARATSLVRYLPGSHFPTHEHGGGEEVFVLAGEFADEHGVYPTGSYLRNPPGTRHAPRSGPGCLLFVKLRQFQPGDAQTVRIDTASAPWQPGPAPGIAVLPLHSHAAERVVLERWSPGSDPGRREYPGGAEILVIEGELGDQQGQYGPLTWLRLPPGASHCPESTDGCLLYCKVGHLPPVLR
jgi:anti-sigma factor ChrR (cupin superfamily)